VLIAKSLWTPPPTPPLHPLPPLELFSHPSIVFPPIKILFPQRDHHLSQAFPSLIFILTLYPFTQTKNDPTNELDVMHVWKE
jgi:hypothetical protein